MEEEVFISVKYVWEMRCRSLKRILDLYFRADQSSKIKVRSNLTPQSALKNFLDEFVIGQERAKKSLGSSSL